MADTKDDDTCTTNVDSLVAIKEVAVVKNHETKIEEACSDLSLGAETCFTALQSFYKHDDAAALEILHKMTGMYLFSGTRSLQAYLILISFASDLPPFFRLEAVTTLCTYNSRCNDDERATLGYSTLDSFCSDMGDLPTPCKIKAIQLLMKGDTNRESAVAYFTMIINDPELECDFRYKAVLSLEDKRINDYYLHHVCLSFLYNQDNPISYRILASQCLLQKCELDEPDPIIHVLIGFAQDETVDYNLRADSADVVLRLGPDAEKEIARDIIMALGRQDLKGTVSVYRNQQNVHTDEIDESTIEIIEFLSTIRIGKITFDDIEAKLKAEPDDRITVALNRINMDRALYSKFNYTVENILLRVWVYVQKYEDAEGKATMMERIHQELREMAGTCSSGFSSRLCNVISGFSDVNLRISWCDQIIANFEGRLNARARDIVADFPENQVETIVEMYLKEDTLLSIQQTIDAAAEVITREEIIQNNRDVAIEEYSANVMIEMAEEPDNYQDRKHSLHFIRTNLSSIREELFTEFEEFMDPADFDLYFRRAIAHYEGQIIDLKTHFKEP